jgi:hypothetical protein
LKPLSGGKGTWVSKYRILIRTPCRRDGLFHRIRESE